MRDQWEEVEVRAERQARRAAATAQRCRTFCLSVRLLGPSRPSSPLARAGRAGRDHSAGSEAASQCPLIFHSRAKHLQGLPLSDE